MSLIARPLTLPPGIATLLEVSGDAAAAAGAYDYAACDLSAILLLKKLVTMTLEISIATYYDASNTTGGSGSTYHVYGDPPLSGTFHPKAQLQLNNSTLGLPCCWGALPGRNVSATANLVDPDDVTSLVGYLSSTYGSEPPITDIEEIAAGWWWQSSQIAIGRKGAVPQIAMALNGCLLAAEWSNYTVLVQPGPDVQTPVAAMFWLYTGTPSQIVSAPPVNDSYSSAFGTATILEGGGGAGIPLNYRIDQFNGMSAAQIFPTATSTSGAGKGISSLALAVSDDS